MTHFGYYGRMVVALPQAAHAINWKAKYSQFMKYFAFDIPPLGRENGMVIIKTKSLKNATGRASVKFNRASREMVSPITLTMSTQLMMEEFEAEGTFLHEMIHVWMYHQGHFDENHGPLFVAKAKEISSHTGHNITVTHDTKHLSINPDVHAKAKPVGILVFESENIKKPLVSWVSEKIVRQNMDAIVRSAEQMTKRYKGGTVHIFLDKHELMHDYSIQRTTRLKWYYIDRHKLEHLLSGTDYLRKIEFDEARNAAEKIKTQQERDFFNRLRAERGHKSRWGTPAKTIHLGM